MNVIEEYSREVSEALSQGIDVPVCSGMTCYTVQYLFANHVGLRDWDRTGETYFATRDSAENYIIYKIYESTCSTIQAYLERRKEDTGNVPASDAEYLAKDIAAGTRHHFDPQIVSDIAEDGQSQSLLEWFLNTSYEDIYEWHQACWFGSDYFFQDRYELDETAASVTRSSSPTKRTKSKLTKQQQNERLLREFEKINNQQS